MPMCHLASSTSLESLRHLRPRARLPPCSPPQGRAAGVRRGDHPSSHCKPLQQPAGSPGSAPQGPRVPSQPGPSAPVGPGPGTHTSCRYLKEDSCPGTCVNWFPSRYLQETSSERGSHGTMGPDPARIQALPREATDPEPGRARPLQCGLRLGPLGSLSHLWVSQRVHACMCVLHVCVPTGGCADTGHVCKSLSRAPSPAPPHHHPLAVWLPGAITPPNAARVWLAPHGRGLDGAAPRGQAACRGGGAAHRGPCAPTQLGTRPRASPGWQRPRAVRAGGRGSTPNPPARSQRCPRPGLLQPSEQLQRGSCENIPAPRVAVPVCTAPGLEPAPRHRGSPRPPCPKAPASGGGRQTRPTCPSHGGLLHGPATGTAGAGAVALHLPPSQTNANLVFLAGLSRARLSSCPHAHKCASHPVGAAAGAGTFPLPHLLPAGLGSWQPGGGFPAAAGYSQLGDVLGDAPGQRLQVLVAAADDGVQAGAFLRALGPRDAARLLLACERKNGVSRAAAGGDPGR